MKKKVLVIGANGFLGNKLMEILPKYYEVHGTYHCRDKAHLIQLDVADEEKVKSVINDINPDIVILTAAQTNVDSCEKNKKEAYDIHVKGVENVVKNCQAKKLIYYSTDNVFDGKKGNYSENDETNPINYYAETKLIGESFVKTLKDYLILRLCMLYSDQEDSPKYVNWVIRSLYEGKKVTAITDLIATPTLIDDAAIATVKLIKKKSKGIYHVTGATALSAYDMAIRIAEIFSFDKGLIVPVKEADLKRFARRPYDTSLSIKKLEREGIKMSTFDGGVMKVKMSLKKQGFFDNYSTLKECRICKSRKLKPYLNLGNVPLVNSYVHPSDASKKDSRYPLKTLYCSNCSLSQLSVIVKPEIMYRNYFYRSSISKTFREHCYEFALDTMKGFGFNQHSFIVEIASNDGCALKEFKKFNPRILGVDPAINLAEIANNEGIITIPEFWNETTAKKILEKNGKADMIFGMNVFAHVHNLDSFLEGVKILLKDSGVFAVEFPYLVNFMNKTEFDTTYHEHLSYFLLKPLIHLFNRHGFEVFHVKKFPIHGGAVRIYTKRKSNNKLRVDKDSIKWLLDLEADLGLHKFDTYANFSKHVNELRVNLVKVLKQLKKTRNKIAAYGASAKGNILLNYCDIGKNMIDYIIDDTPEKQGYFIPGQHIPIVDSSYLKKQKPDYLLLLAWNFAEELMKKTEEYKNSGGRYIIPIPNVKVI